jgi:glutathione synthase
MTMRLLIVADPVTSFKTHKDSTYALMVAALARGHSVAVCELGQIWLEAGQVWVAPSDLNLEGPQYGEIGHDPKHWCRLQPASVDKVVAYDAVLLRKDPPFDLEYIYATWLLEHAQRDGARVFNHPRAVRDHGEKFSITEFSDLIAPTLITRDPVRLRAFVAQHQKAVFKLLDGMGGASIFLARHDDPNLSVIIETLNQFGARTVMAQRYLPEIAEGDKRILLIGGQCVPYALARIPQAGEARGNLAAGGRAHVQALSDQDRHIAQTLAPVLAARGLFLVGLDVIGSCLTEINVTSPTGFREVMDQTGFDVAGLFIDQLVRAVAG